MYDFDTEWDRFHHDGSNEEPSEDPSPWRRFLATCAGLGLLILMLWAWTSGYLTTL